MAVRPLSLPKDAPDAPRILVVRRDNIGDLICTLPVFEGLRQRYPQAHIGALVNSYNAPLLKHNPFVDQVHIYTKSKHGPDRGSFGLIRDRIDLLFSLRACRYQVAVHAGTRPRVEMRTLTRLAGITVPVLDAADNTPRHEIERVYALLERFGIKGAPPAPRLIVPAAETRKAQQILAEQGFENAVGLHISAREDENRWPLENFISLIKEGSSQGLKFVIFWSPGDITRPEHPGDDKRAQTLLAQCQGLPVIPYPTRDLLALAAGLSAVRVLIGSDGGHCHIAAAVNTPVIGLYCEHKVTQWRPWGQDHLAISAKQVAGILMENVLSSLRRTTI